MKLKKVTDFTEGQILCIDKPLEWSSFQAVNKIRWAIRKKFNLQKIKVGHAGTLDPLATGLLLVCIGKYTKKIPYLQGQIKEYIGTFTLGATTPSYDMETTINNTFATDNLSEAKLLATAERFKGVIKQNPPVFSALKKNGKRLYEYARKNITIEIPEREVYIEKFEITNIKNKIVDFKVICSKGTYIRSLAHDYGKALNSGAYLSSLRRTRIGSFEINDSITPLEFEKRLLV